MRSIAAALIGIALAAGASYAHTNRTDASGREAGTPTCATKPGPGLVFGRSPVADCSFVAERGGVREEPRARLAYSAQANEAEQATQTLAIRALKLGQRSADGEPRLSRDDEGLLDASVPFP